MSATNYYIDENELTQKLKNDLKDYFKFVALVQQKRSLKSTRLIEEYIKNESDITHRIHFIEELDREEPYSSRAESDVTTDDIKKAKQRLSAKKQLLKPTSFLNYIFSTRKLVKSFADRTNIIISHVFSLRTTGESEFHYKKIINESTNLLMKPLNYLVEHGWEKLDRRSYNVVVTFNKFIRLFVQMGNIFRHDDHKFTFKELEQYIHLYLQVVSKKSNVEILKEAFYEILFFVPSYKALFREMVKLVNEINNTESRGLCFFNIILGLFMVRYRRFVRMNEIINHYNIQDIDDSHYDFNPKIAQYIKDTLNTMEHKYKEAEKRLFFLRFLEESISFRMEPTNPVFPLFGKVYYSEHLKYPKTVFDLRKENSIDNLDFMETFPSNITGPMSQFINGYLRVYGKFLRGQATLQYKDGSKQPRSIFKDWIFASELEKLQQSHNDLENLKASNAYFSIPLKTYTQYNKTKKTELEREEKLCSIMESISNAFYSIAEMISTILYNHFSAQNLKGEEIFSAATSQDKPIEKISSDPRLLPFAMHSVVDDNYLQNQLVHSIFNEIIVFTLNFTMLLEHTTLRKRLSEKQKYISQTEEYLNMKSKIEV